MADLRRKPRRPARRSTTRETRSTSLRLTGVLPRTGTGSTRLGGRRWHGPEQGAGVVPGRSGGSGAEGLRQRGEGHQTQSGHQDDLRHQRRADRGTVADRLRDGLYRSDIGSGSNERHPGQGQVPENVNPRRRRIKAPEAPARLGASQQRPQDDQGERGVQQPHCRRGNRAAHDQSAPAPATTSPPPRILTRKGRARKPTKAGEPVSGPGQLGRARHYQQNRSRGVYRRHNRHGRRC